MPKQRRTTVRRAPLQSRRRTTSRSQSWFAVIALLTIVAMLIGAVGSAVVLDLFDDDDDTIDIAPNEEDEVEQLYREDLAARPDDPQTIAILANYLSQSPSGDGEEAVRLYERALAIVPDDEDMRYDFGRALVDTGSNLDAEIQFKKVIESGAGGVYVGLSMLELARLYRDWSPPRLDDAIAMYQRAAAIPGDTGIRDTAVEELAELGVVSPVSSPAVAGPATPITTP